MFSAFFFLTLSCIVCVAFPSFPCVGYYLRCSFGFRRKNHNHQILREVLLGCVCLHIVTGFSGRRDDGVFGAMTFVAC